SKRYIQPSRRVHSRITKISFAENKKQIKDTAKAKEYYKNNFKRNKKCELKHVQQTPSRKKLRRAPFFITQTTLIRVSSFKSTTKSSHTEALNPSSRHTPNNYYGYNNSTEQLYFFHLKSRLIINNCYECGLVKVVWSSSSRDLYRAIHENAERNLKQSLCRIDSVVSI
ncbi:hypothetical protein FF38_08638, partial [Lucilia cuprina]